jgi:hypothetical protein
MGGLFVCKGTHQRILFFIDQKPTKAIRPKTVIPVRSAFVIKTSSGREYTPAAQD